MKLLEAKVPTATELSLIAAAAVGVGAWLINLYMAPGDRRKRLMEAEASESSAQEIVARATVGLLDPLNRELERVNTRLETERRAREQLQCQVDDLQHKVRILTQQLVDAGIAPQA